ncbi:MAG: CDP-alcohol phosphatidyltransferase family protein [Methanomicrobia archaeon]|nr:CDP-alcohol phosphatidyltransferase family protein [Methanomicrobia archaeon]
MRIADKGEGLPGMTARAALLTGLLTLLCVSALLTYRFALGGLYFGAVLTAYLLIVSGIVAKWPRHQPQLEFGIANGVTLLRAIGVCLIVGTLTLATIGPRLIWMVAGIAGCTLLLDGCDGRLARHYGITSAFGARFDLEVDALLIMILCVVLVVHYDQAVWILAIGLLRYLFVGAGLLMTWLRAPLAGSIRGRAICCYQVLALILALLPWSTAVRELLLVSALLLLIYSFTSDIRSLHKRAADGVPAVSSST